MLGKRPRVGHPRSHNLRARTLPRAARASVNNHASGARSQAPWDEQLRARLHCPRQDAHYYRVQGECACALQSANAGPLKKQPVGVPEIGVPTNVLRVVHVERAPLFATFENGGGG